MFLVEFGSISELALVVYSAIYVESAYRRVCYYTNWAQYRHGAGKFLPENIDPKLCTHIIYAFAKLIGNKLHPFEWNDESTPWMKGMYCRVQSLKKINPHLKIMIAVGGWNLGSSPFTDMVATAANREEFATTTVKFLRDNNFDGLDLDWEYPANRGSPPDDKHRYAQLLEVLKQEFVSEAKISKMPRLLLSAATAAGRDKIDTAYDFLAMTRYLDMINLMTYDLHGSWEGACGHNAPLYKHDGEKGNMAYLNVDSAASYYVSKGVPPAMINIGMPLYGRSFMLKDPHDHDVGAPITGAGLRGKYTSEAGFLAYYEICELLKNGGHQYYIADQKVPYVITGSDWIGYDDKDSLRLKVRYVKQHHFGGIMVWTLDLDDFSGSCGEGKYPLLHAINDELNGKSEPIVDNKHLPFHSQQTAQISQHPLLTHATLHTHPATHVTLDTNPSTNVAVHTYPATHVTEHTHPATHVTEHTYPETHVTTHTHLATTGSAQSHIDAKNFCKHKSDGHYTDPNSCTEFFECSNGLTFLQHCPLGTVFNMKIVACDFPHNVPGCSDAA